MNAIQKFRSGVQIMASATQVARIIVVLGTLLAHIAVAASETSASNGCRPISAGHNLYPIREFQFAYSESGNSHAMFSLILMLSTPDATQGNGIVKWCAFGKGGAAASQINQMIERIRVSNPNLEIINDCATVGHEGIEALLSLGDLRFADAPWINLVSCHGDQCQITWSDDC
jgi:hypothetical protein